jgi:hypothetical protein
VSHGCLTRLGFCAHAHAYVCVPACVSCDFCVLCGLSVRVFLRSFTCAVFGHCGAFSRVNGSDRS